MIERSYGTYFPKDLDGGVKTLGGFGTSTASMAKTGTSLARAVGDGLTTANDQMNQKWSHEESKRVRG
jgi:hypothetical protein